MKFSLPNGVEAEAKAFRIVDGEKVPMSDDEIPEEIVNRMKENLSEINVRKCEMCDSMNDCRPYGPKGQEICQICASKDTVSTYIAAKAHKGEDYAKILLSTISESGYTQDVDLSKMN